ncbi:MAG: DNA polymerase III subunit beta [Bacilli bacterium]|nr:DNA polymerase III subunit beta [Bacilli bacterium]
MRFTINREEFLKALNVVSKPIPSKSFVASLIFVKLVLDDRGLNLIGSNETIAISTLIPFAKNDQEIIRNAKNGAILVQGRYLVEIVRKLSGKELTFDVMDNAVVEISDEKSNFQLNSAQAEEYPEYDFNEDGKEFNVNTKEFVALVEQTSFAAANKENRPMLTALNLTAENKKLTAIALDAARYAKKEIAINEEVEFVANIPAKTINEIIRMFEEAETINIVVNERKMFFKFNNTIVASNLLNGEYPNVKNIVPKSFNYFLEANAEELLSAIDRVSLLTNDKNTVRLVITQDDVEVSSTTSEVGSAKEKINTFHYEGERLEILFNSSFVIDAIKALRAEDVVLQFIGEFKPFVIKDTKNDNIIQLITPVRA